MADSKITALTAISTVDPTADPLVIVDVSDTSMAASGTTKKSTINQLLGAGGTATLASATITGDLTVDTSTLKVDSTNNRVIVGHTSGSSAFQVTNAGAAGLEIQPTGFSSAPLILSYNRSGSAYTQLTLDGSTIVHALNGSTAMTLNSTGLGIGVTSALSKLTVAGSNLTTASWGISSIYSTDSMAIDKGGSITFGGAFTGTTVTYFAQISGRKENSTDSDVAGYLALSSRPTGGLTTDRMRVKSNGQIRFIPLAADPSGAEAGDVYYNSTSNKLKCYNGTTWNDLF